MDWRLPGADGVTVAKQIRASAQSGAPPLVIMVTAYGREALLDAAEREAVPFAAVLGKPCTPLQISEAFNAALHGQPARAPAPPPVHALRGRRVLVVEDNALNRQVARDMLISAGAEVLLAEDGLSGVQLATTGAPPDVVLMDMQMPDIDGLEATRRIRCHPNGATLPIIAMTANVASADRDACLAAGMNRHIGKPITLAAMTAAILGELGAPASATPSTGVAAAALVESWADILRRFNHERDIYANALLVFPTEAACSLATLARGGTPAALAAELHSLKGMAATVGASGLAQQAAQYEAALRAGQPVPATLAADLQALVDASHAALQAQAGSSATPPQTLAVAGDPTA
jgi:CheY-like chemotaxis protein